MTLKSRRSKWLKAAMATVGAGALALSGAALPAAAEENEELTPFSLDGDKYELAAERHGASASELEQLEATGSIVVTNDGFIMHVDETPANLPAITPPVETFSAVPAGREIPGNPSEGSRSGAPVTVFLDFSGPELADTLWNEETGLETIDFLPAADADEAFQADVWAAVAEDFAPFNINVTTSHPGEDALYKTSEDDSQYGVHVIITDTSELPGPAFESGVPAGVAFYSGTGSHYLSGALVFTDGHGSADTAKNIADTATHEAGHNFGNGHAGWGDEEYYDPEGGVWGPIMGSTWNVPLSQWTAGEYNNSVYAAEGQDGAVWDDLANITDRGSAAAYLLALDYEDGTPYMGSFICHSGEPNTPPAPGDTIWAVDEETGICDQEVELVPTWTFTDRADYASDDHGDTADSATELDNGEGNFEVNGVIGQSDDVDVFEITTAGGTITAQVEVADQFANLNAQLTLTDADGQVIETDAGAPAAVSETVATGLGANITADVEAGVYYLEVEGVGFGDPSDATLENANGFSGYGSLGHYALTGEADPLVTADITITSPEDGTEVTGQDDVDVTGTATPEAEVSVTVNGDAVTTEVDAEGDWSLTVPADSINDHGNTEIVATQQLDDISLDGSASVTVTAPVPAPEITEPSDDSSTEDTEPTVSGTGIPGATVNVSVTSTSGDQFTAEAEVDADGNWTVQLPELGDGAYVITASQTINGVTSESSNSVTLTVSVTDDNGNGGGGDGDGDDTLPDTGAEFGFAPFALLALLLMGGGAAALTLRNRKSAIES